MNDNLRLVWSHDSTQWGLIQLHLLREREEKERIEAAKSDVDRFHEDALRRFHARSINGEGSIQPSGSESQAKVNLAQQVDESRRVYWKLTENGFEPISK